jgi:hypothetical protein
MATTFIVGTARGRESHVGEEPAPTVEEVLVWWVVVSDGAVIAATGDDAWAPTDGAFASASEAVEVLETPVNEQPMLTARGERTTVGELLSFVAREECLALGEHGDGVEAPEVPIGAAIVAARDAEVGVPEAPSTN